MKALGLLNNRSWQTLNCTTTDSFGIDHDGDGLDQDDLDEFVTRCVSLCPLLSGR